MCIESSWGQVCHFEAIQITNYQGIVHSEYVYVIFTVHDAEGLALFRARKSALWVTL